MVDGVHDHRGVQYELGPALQSRPRGADVFLQAFALGIGFRFGLHVNPDSKGLYISEDLFVILSVRFVFQLAPPRSRPCDIYCVAMRIHCCRLYPAREACEVSGVWKAPSCVPAPHYDYVCCLRHYHISHSGAGL